MEKRLLKNLVIDFFHLSSSHDARFFNSVKSIKFANYLLSNSAPHEPRCFLASVFQRLQQNRAAASCSQARHYPGRTCALWKPLCLRPAFSASGKPSSYRSQASWGPLPARSLTCASWNRRQWSTSGGSRRPLVRQVPTHRCHLSKRANPACKQISDACRSVASGSSNSRAAAAVGV